MIRLAQSLSSAASKTLGVLLFIFGYFVTTKSFSVEQDEYSVLSLVSLAVGLFIILIHSFDELRKVFVVKQSNSILIACFMLLISSSLAVIAASVLFRHDFEIFVSREIGVLWTLHGSSKLYRTIILLLSYSVDCCKIHTLVTHQFR